MHCVDFTENALFSSSGNICSGSLPSTIDPSFHTPGSFSMDRINNSRLLSRYKVSSFSYNSYKATGCLPIVSELLLSCKPHPMHSFLSICKSCYCIHYIALYKSTCLNSGQLFFINSRRMHEGYYKSFCRCVCYCTVFWPPRPSLLLIKLPHICSWYM